MSAKIWQKNQNVGQQILQFVGENSSVPAEIIELARQSDTEELGMPHR